MTATNNGGEYTQKEYTLSVVAGDTGDEVVPGCEDNASIPAIECAALAALYDTTDGDNWTNNTGWLSGDPCEWSGVSCEDNHVTTLGLGSNQLSGPIPSELGQLFNLEVLWLNGNQLSGPIPSELGQLPNLEVLLLRNNGCFTASTSIAEFIEAFDPLWDNGC